MLQTQRRTQDRSVVARAYTYTRIARVSNRKCRSMKNEFVSVVSSRPTLGKIETTQQIGYAPGKVREKAILSHKAKYKKMAT